MEQEEIIRQAVNYALSKFNNNGTCSFWNKQGHLNVRELYKYLTPKLGFKSFKAPSEFESYIKYNIRKFNLFGKLDLSMKSKAGTHAKYEEIIESFNYALIPTSITPENDDYVVRTKLGNGHVRFYCSGKLSASELNQLKGAYGKVEGIKYYDVRPCLYKNWITWSDERQQASSWREEDSFTR